MRISTLSVLTFCLTLLAVPATATVYANGQPNGQVTSWQISNDAKVSDSFYFPISRTPTFLKFEAWVTPNDVISSVTVDIGGAPFGTLFTGTFTPTQTNCITNVSGANVCEETVTILAGAPLLPPGTYYVTLRNATAPHPVFWDENSGVGCISQNCPSTALYWVDANPRKSFRLN